jgi:hypothetical protein
MPSISLCSFLKILSQGTPQKTTEYAKYLTPGGYDFYWRLKDAAFSMTVGGQAFDQCVQPLNGIKPPHGSCSSPKGHLTIKLVPEFGLVDAGTRQLVHLWNSKQPDLKPAIAGVGIYLMQQHLCIDEFADCACVILDLRKRRILSVAATAPQTPSMVSSEFAWIDNFFEQASKAA